MEKLDTSLAINASMEDGKKLMAAVRKEIGAVFVLRVLSKRAQVKRRLQVVMI